MFHCWSIVTKMPYSCNSKKKATYVIPKSRADLVMWPSPQQLLTIFSLFSSSLCIVSLWYMSAWLDWINYIMEIPFSLCVGLGWANRFLGKIWRSEVKQLPFFRSHSLSGWLAADSSFLHRAVDRPAIISPSPGSSFNFSNSWARCVFNLWWRRPSSPVDAHTIKGRNKFIPACTSFPTLYTHKTTTLHHQVYPCILSKGAKYL